MLNHTILVQNQSPGADGIFTHDISVNPLSVLLVNLRPLNDTSTLTNFARWLGVCSAINRLTVRHRGQSVISMRGDDAAAMAVLRHGYQPWLANPDNTNNERLCVTLPIFMGRRAYDPRSCFPESRRGELQLELDLDIADTGYDALQYTVEGIEILGASPVEFERKVQLAQTFAATGVNDVDLPIGNLLRGCLLFGTTGFAGASPVPSWGRIQLIADGIGVGYSSADFETLYNLAGLRTAPPVSDHVHVENTAGTYAQNAVTGRGYDVGADWINRAYLDLDPTGDDQFSINSAQVSRLQLRADAETADAVRVIPVERMTPAQLA